MENIMNREYEIQVDIDGLSGKSINQMTNSPKNEFML